MVASLRDTEGKLHQVLMVRDPSSKSSSQRRILFPSLVLDSNEGNDLS